MSYPTYPPPRKPLPATVAIPKAPSRRRNTGLLVAVLLVLFFGASAVGLALFLPSFKAVKNSQIVADLFLRDLERQDYRSALNREYYGGEDGFQMDLPKLMRQIRKRNGIPVRHTGPEKWKIEASPDDGSTWVRFVYRETYKNKKSATVELLMCWQNSIERWRVGSVDFK